MENVENKTQNDHAMESLHRKQKIFLLHLVCYNVQIRPILLFWLIWRQISCSGTNLADNGRIQLG